MRGTWRWRYRRGCHEIAGLILGRLVFAPPMLRIAYLLADTGLSGGIRVIAAQADGLVARGHEVTLVTTGAPLTWRRSRAKWLYVNDWRGGDASAFDFVVGTCWTTVRAAYELAPERAIHLSQGYEGSFTAYAAVKE